MTMTNWKTAKVLVHDASGVTNPSVFKWERTRNVYYPVSKFNYQCANCGEAFDTPELNQFEVMGCPFCGHTDYKYVGDNEDPLYPETPNFGRIGGEQ